MDVKDIAQLILNEGVTDDPEEAMALAEVAYVYEDVNNDADLGWAIIQEQGGLGELDKETLHRYFDYDQFGYDSKISDYIIKNGSTYIHLMEV